MYTLADYGHMLLDSTRLTAYRDAMRSVIGPESVVLDLGAGPGLLAIVAAKLGARRVYALEVNPAVRLVRRLAQINGVAERIEVFEGDARTIDTGIRADVLVADLRGTLPLHGNGPMVIHGVRQRLLAESGIVIGSRDTLVAAPVTCEKAYRHALGVWRGGPLGVDMDWLAEIQCNSWSKVRLDAASLLCAGRELFRVGDDRIGADPPTRHAGRVEFVVESNATLHGLLVWFEADLAGGIGFSSGPFRDDTIHGQAFFPIQEPVQLSGRCTLSFSLSADFVRSTEEWIWSWVAELALADGTRKRFAGSTFAANLPLLGAH